MAEVELQVTLAIEVSGELDISTAGALRDELMARILAAGSQSFTVDLSGITFVDAAGMRPLFEVRRAIERRGGTVCFRAPSLAVMRLERAAGWSLTPACEGPIGPARELSLATVTRLGAARTRRSSAAAGPGDPR